MIEFAEGCSLTCQRRDIILSRHCAPGSVMQWQCERRDAYTHHTHIKHTYDRWPDLCVLAFYLVRLWTQVVTVKRLAEEYNKGLPAAIDAVRQHNQRAAEELKQAGATRQLVERALLEEPQPCPVDFNDRWIRRWMATFDWRRKPTNTAGAFLEWSDPRLVASRARVAEHIANGCHKYLIINFDQVWRQSLRSCSTVMMKGPNSPLPKLCGGRRRHTYILHACLHTYV